MKPFAHLILAVLAGIAAAVDVTEPATIIASDGREIAASVMVETLDSVEYKIGVGADGEATSSLARTKVRAVVYQNEINDIEYNRGRGALARQDYDKAATAFLMAGAKGSSFRVREGGLIAAADAYRRGHNPDEALKAIADLETRAPRSVQLPRAYELKIALLLEKGDRGAIAGTLAVLAKLDPMRGALARADLQRVDKKPAEAAKELQAVWASAPRQAAVEGDATYDSLGFQLAADLVAAGNAAGANDIFAKLCYGATSGAGRARAHLALAKALSESADAAQLDSAIDHALMAGVIAGGDKIGAKKLALAIIAKLDKDPARAKEAAEYRASVNAL